jgi:hypothetical protein
MLMHNYLNNIFDVLKISRMIYLSISIFLPEVSYQMMCTLHLQRNQTCKIEHLSQCVALVVPIILAYLT